jgi:predicted permease
VVSYGFWQQELGGDASAVGRKVTLNGHPFPVIGVTPASFFGLDVGHQFEIAVPLCSEPVVEPDRRSVDRRTYWWLAAIGRLKPGVMLQQADAAMKALAPRIFRATLPPDLPTDDAKQFLSYRLEAVAADSGFSSVGRQYADPRMLALSIAGLVLLIACANLANLMLARASVRKREIAVRLALGARRGRVVAQLLVEGMLLAIMGAAAGVLLAQILSRALVAFLNTSEGEQVSLRTSPDWRVFGFTAGLAILTCVLFGLAPALRATRVGPNAALEAAGRGMSDGPERFGLRRFLVISQVALSLVLLTGALLFVRSLTNLLTMDAGFRQEGVLQVDLDMRDRRLLREQQQLFNQHVLERLRSIPGVRGAASAAIAPATDDWWSERVGLDGTENRWEMINVDRVGEGFFRTLGIGKVGGRDFDRHDTPETAKVVIVNEAFARKMAGGKNPIGRRLRIQTNPGQPEPWYEIVGLVRDTKYGTLRDPFGPIVYVAESQTTETIA